MKILALAVLASLSLPFIKGVAFAENPAASALGQDPLTEQIRRKAIQPNGGVTSVVRLGSGQTVELKVVELDVQPVGGAKTVSFSAPADALAKLKPVDGLVEKKKAAKAARSDGEVKQAVDQAKIIKKDGWSAVRAVGHRSAL